MRRFVLPLLVMLLESGALRRRRWASSPARPTSLPTRARLRRPRPRSPVQAPSPLAEVRRPST